MGKLKQISPLFSNRLKFWRSFISFVFMLLVLCFEEFLTLLHVLLCLIAFNLLVYLVLANFKKVETLIFLEELIRQQVFGLVRFILTLVLKLIERYRILFSEICFHSSHVLGFLARNCLVFIPIVPKVVVTVGFFEIFFSFAFISLELITIVVEFFFAVEFLLNSVGVLLIEIPIKHVQIIFFSLSQHPLHFLIPGTWFEVTCSGGRLLVTK